MEETKNLKGLWLIVLIIAIIGALITNWNGLLSPDWDIYRFFSHLGLFAFGALSMEMRR